MAFWRRGGKKKNAESEGLDASGEVNIEKLQKQFGIATVSDSAVQAELQMLLRSSSTHRSGVDDDGLDLTAICNDDGVDVNDDEEANILKELGIDTNFNFDEVDMDSYEQTETSTSHVEIVQEVSLEDKIRQLKAESVRLKREGRIQEALAVFREIKALESAASQPSALEQTITASVSVRNETTVDATGTISTTSTHEVTQLNNTGGSGQESPSDPTVESLEIKINALKQQAVAHKRGNRLSEALRCMREFKALEAQCDVLLRQKKVEEVKESILPEFSGGGVLVPREDTEENVEVTEDDMNDPSFDAELQRLGFSSTHETTSAPLSLTSLQQQVSSVTTTTTTVTDAVDVSSRDTTRQSSRSYTYTASASKSSFDEEEFIDEFDNSDGSESERVHRPREVVAQSLDTTTTTTSTMIIQEQASEVIHVSEGKNSNSVEAEIEILRQQLAQTKTLALTRKREGNTKEAVLMLRRMKQIEHLIQSKEKRSVELSRAPHTTSTGPEQDQNQKQFDVLEQHLVDFGNRMMSAAKEELSKDRVKAAAYVAKRKYYVSELEKLRTLRQNPHQLPPSFSIQSTIEEMKYELHHIPEDQIHVQILSVYDLGANLGGKDIFVKFCLNFPSQSPHEGKTNPITLSASSSKEDNASSKSGRRLSKGNGGGASATFDGAATSFAFSIQRSRGFQRLFELKKAVFEVWRPGGLWSNPEMVARGYQELSPLLSVCEIKCRVPFVGSNRKPTGGDVEICMSMRSPLKQEEVRSVTSETLVVGEYPAIVNPSPPSSSSIQLPPSSSPGSLSTSTTVQRVSVSSSTRIEPVPTIVRQSSLEEEQTDPHDLEFIISYDVMQDEMEKIKKKIDTMSSGSPEAVELGDRYDSLAFKRQLLEIEMQTGKLTLDMYVGQLRARIAEDRVMIERLMGQSRRIDAARVLHRVKVMQKELEGADQQS